LTHPSQPSILKPHQPPPERQGQPLLSPEIS
jgi:hypothetical protein